MRRREQGQVCWLVFAPITLLVKLVRSRLVLNGIAALLAQIKAMCNRNRRQ